LSSSIFGVFHLLHLDNISTLGKYVVILVSGIIIILLKNVFYRKIDIYFLIVFLMLLSFSSWIGLYFENDVNRIIIDFVSIFLPILTFIKIKNSDTQFNAYFLEMFINVVLAVSIIQSCLMFILKEIIDIPFNLTFSSPLYSLLFLFFYANKNYIKLTVILTIIIIGGKRSPLLMALISFAFYNIFYYFSYLTKERIIKLFSLFIFLAFLIFIVILNIDFLVSINPKLAKLESLNIFNENFNFYKFSTGRLEEVIIAYKELIEKGNFAILTGGGLGFNFLYYLPQFNFEEVRNNLHISLFSILFKYGFVFFMFFYFFLFFNATNLYKKTKNNQNKEQFVLFSYIFTYIIFYSNTSSAFIIDYTFWFLFGIAFLINDSKKENNVKKNN
jgi:hypothetical protein